MTFDAKRASVVAARIGLPIALLIVAAVVGLKFATSSLVTNMWSPLLESQIALYGAVWLALCAAVWLAARLRGIGFEAALIAVVLPLIVLAAGVSTSSAVALVFVDAFLVGAVIARPDPDEASAPVLMAAGLAVMAMVTGAAQLFRINSRWSFAAVSLGLLLLLFDVRVRAVATAWLWRVRSALRSSDTPPRSFVSDIAIALVVGVLGLHLLFALQPERYYDALAVHLYVPSYVLAHGRWSFDVSKWVFAHMPLTVDFLYTWAFALGGENAVRLYNFSALVLITSLIISWLRTLTSNSTPLVAALLFLSTPVTFIETSSLFIENTLAVWITAAALLATTRWRDMSVAVGRTILVLLAATVAAKLHGVLAAGLIGPIMIIAFVRMRPGLRRWLSLAVAAVVCGAFAMLPYVSAFVDTGNPVFPFFNKIFRSRFWPPENFLDTRWAGHFTPALLWNATFDSAHYLEGWNGSLGLSLLVFLPLACLYAILSRAAIERWALFIGLGLVLLVGSQVQYLRYFYIAFPVLFFVIGRLMDFGYRFPLTRAVTLGVATLGLAAGLFLLPSAGWIFAQSDFRADFDPEARRLLVLSQVPELFANRFINEVAGNEARVYYTGSPFTALLEGVGLSSNWYNTRYVSALQTATTPDAVGALFKQMEIGYVVLNPDPPSPLLTATTTYVKTHGRLRATFGALQVYEIGQT